MRGLKDDWELKTLEIRPAQEQYKSLYDTLAASGDYEIVSVDEFLPDDR